MVSFQRPAHCQRIAYCREGAAYRRYRVRLQSPAHRGEPRDRENTFERRSVRHLKRVEGGQLVRDFQLVIECGKG